MIKNPTAPLNVNEIQQILPHRFPFLLIDRINAMDLDAGTIEGQKNVTGQEDYFQGHFPGAPIMPGVLILESIAQTGAVLVGVKRQTDKIAVLMHIREAKFRRSVKPGDLLQLYCQEIHFNSRAGKVKGVAKVGEEIVTECEVTFALVDKERI